MLYIWDKIKFILDIPAMLIDKIPYLPDFAKDALNDSINLIPFLFLVFLLIEVIEHYYVRKKHLFVFFMKKVGPLFGSLFASIPQCGFSVIASTLYTKRILSRGTIIAVYLATSDEAIPVLISNPSQMYIILPIISIKVICAIFVGYLVDALVKYEPKNEDVTEEEIAEDIHHVKGCCKHEISSEDNKKSNLWYHPLKHTFGIFIFILIISLLLGYGIEKVGTEENLAKYLLINSPFQPIIASFVGLIPNCAISVAFTMLFIKHSISFGSLLAGLMSSGGLGLLVLMNKNKDIKDTMLILAILVVVSSIFGIIVQNFDSNILNMFSMNL